MKITTMAILAIAVLTASGCGSGARTAAFDAINELQVKVPEGAKEVRIWFALPQESPEYQISDLRIETQFPYRITADSVGNRVLYIEAREPKQKTITVATPFRVRTHEVRKSPDAGRTRPLTEAERQELQSFLAPNRNVVINDEIRLLAARVTGGEKNPVRAARAIYDWVLANIDYWVKDPANKKASPVGSSEYCLSTRTGNCTDFHSLWASLARAEGIPTRLVYGSLFKKELDGQDTDQSYHCWIEFYAPDLGWIPLDVAVADIYAGDFKLTPENEVLVRRTTADGFSGPEPVKVSYYFGSLEERRVPLSTGRDLVLDPPPASGPVNALPKALVEADGKPLAEKEGWTRKLTFREIR